MPGTNAPAGRPFGEAVRWEAWPPSRTQTVTLHNLAAEREVVWRMLSAPVEIQKTGRGLFGNVADFRRYWPDLRNYIRQARIYDEASLAVVGPSRALLQYYAALQLAKAELLVRDPPTVFNVRSRHGMSFHPEAAKTLRGDTLRTASGVFTDLYRVRTGEVLPVGTRLGAIDLLAACPEVAFELWEAGLGASRTAPIRHYIAHDASECWSLFQVLTPDVFLESTATMRRLASTYKIVTASGMSPMMFNMPPVVFESRWTVSMTNAPTLSVSDMDTVCDRARTEWAPFIGIPMYGLIQGAPSQRKTRLLPMPPDLARYAAIYYLSSVVRYKPSRLDDQGRSEAAWLMDTFSFEASLHIIRAALAGITGRLLITRSPEAAAIGHL